MSSGRRRTCSAADGWPVVLLLAGLSGCTLPPGGKAAPAVSTVSVETLRESYPDVVLDDCVLVADFQTPDQVHAFRIVAAGDESATEPALGIVPTSEGDESVERVLEFALSGAGERLLLSASLLARPSAPDDWSEFGTLLMSVYGPPDGATVILTLTGGAGGALAWTQNLHAASGWNALRLDLDEVGRQFDLSEVAELALGLPAGSPATTLYLDDLVLANRTRWLLGQHAGAGELYACARGPRLVVGARARFELVFENGLIVGWYARGPENLAAPAGLGPWPLLLPSPTAQADLLMPPRDWRARTTQNALSHPVPRAVELSAFRVVIETGDTAVVQPSASDQPETSPAVRGYGWRYVIYPDGRVYVRAQRTWPQTQDIRVGYAVALSGTAGFRPAPPRSGDPQHPPAEFVLLRGTGADRVDFFWACAAPEAVGQPRLVHAGDHRPLVQFMGDLPAASSAQVAHLLRFWPAWESADAEDLAADYQRPVALRVSAGRIVREAPGDLNHDGFNESEGCYEIGLTRGLARFEYDPGERPRNGPVFRIHDTAGTRCWIYGDGQALAGDQRDADGRVFFKLPGTIRTPRSMEVHTRPAGD